MLESLSNALIEAINDEYKSRAAYNAVISKFGEIRLLVPRLFQTESCPAMLR